MTNYYIKENDIITQSADWKFDNNCLATEENIIRADNGQLILASEYAILQETPEYIAEQKAKNNAIIKQDILKQLSEIDAKSIRALREGNTDRITQYEAQAQKLREQLNATM